MTTNLGTPGKKDGCVNVGQNTNTGMGVDMGKGSRNRLLGEEIRKFEKNMEKIRKREEEPLSNCCGAPPWNEIHDGLAICSRCKEHADFTGDDDEED